VKTRAATRADAGSLTALINAAFAIERSFINRDRTTEAEVLEHLERGQYLITEHDGALAACVFVEVRGERGYFGLLAVHPDHQRGGLGRTLVELAEDHCRAAGCTAMDMQIVDLRVDLPDYYRALGYAEIGTAPWPSEADADLKQPASFLRMSKPL
jgi:N-acetylglutamate synthase-like GNAT family acetyltransferase